MSQDRHVNPPPQQGQGQRIRLFVTLHVVAVSSIFGIALWVGSHCAEAPMPELMAASSAKLASAAEVRRQTPRAGERGTGTVTVSAARLSATSTETALPAWAQSHEINPSWDTR